MIDQALNAKLRSMYNPDGSSLRELQLQLLEILKVIDGICRRNNIPYWLSSGTLLGAVRHGGFIPWDDDVDIEIFYKDRKRFIKACKLELPSNLCVQYHKNEKEYYTNILKVRDCISDIGEKVFLGDLGQFDVPYFAKGYFIDIFCEEEAIPSFVSLSNGVVSRIISKRFVSKWGTDLCHFLFVVQSLFNSIYRLLSKVFANKDYLYHTYGSLFNSRRQKKFIEPLVEIDFEGIKVFAPSNSDGYLHDMFGDYMAIPSESMRIPSHSKLEERN